MKTKKLLFVTDLGNFKAYRVVRDEQDPRPRLMLIDSFVPADSHGTMSSKLTDEAGRFPGGRPGTSARAFGERHNITLEFERRTAQQLADRIMRIVRSEPRLPVIYLAAHKEINRPILDHLDGEIRQRVQKNIQEDLTKAHQTELLEHFRSRELQPVH